MFDYQEAKKSLMDIGYDIVKDTATAALLRKADNEILIQEEEDTFRYVFMHGNQNISFHRNGFGIWASEGHRGYVPTDVTFADPEADILEYGRHWGHHVKDITEISKLVL